MTSLGVPPDVREIMNDGRLVLKETVLHEGWEMDNAIWVYYLPRTDRHYVVMTSHGSPYLPTRAELEAKLAETRHSARSIERALEFLP